MEEKIKSAISYIIIMLITILIGTLAINFLVQKSEKPDICDRDHLYLCDTEEICKNNSFFWWNNSCHVTEESKPKPSEYPDYESLSDMNTLVLIENFITYTPNKVAENMTYGIILRKGKLIKAYIEIIASINDKPLTEWESIYFKTLYNTIDHYKYGGHIFRYESLKTPPGEKTHLLFSLDNIPFIPHLPYSESTEPKKLNLFKIINTNKEVNFLAFISSLEPAKIDIIKIYYKCDRDYNGECELMLKD